MEGYEEVSLFCRVGRRCGGFLLVDWQGFDEATAHCVALIDVSADVDDFAGEEEFTGCNFELRCAVKKYTYKCYSC